MQVVGLLSKTARSSLSVWRFAQDLVHDDFFEGRTLDRERAKSIFSDWNKEVQRFVPPDRLLVFEVTEGWQPLCRFLNVPVPEVAFPRSNERGSFRKEMARRSMRSSH